MIRAIMSLEISANRRPLLRRLLRGVAFSTLPLVMTLGATAADAPSAAPTTAPTTTPTPGPANALAAGPTTGPATNPSEAATHQTVAVVPLPPAATQPVIPDGAAQLLDNLANDKEAVRRHAQEALVKLGEQARHRIEGLLGRTSDLEVITRARGALSQIDDERQSGASSITLHVKDADPRAVLAEMSRQGFASIRMTPEDLFDDGTPKLSFDFERQPFWVAMRQFLDQTGTSFQMSGDGPRIVRGGVRATGPWVVQGPFLIVANTITRTQTIQLLPGNGPGLGAGAVAALNGRADFTLSMTAFAEPKIEVIRAGSVVKVDEAIDDNGNNLASNGPDVRGFFGGVASGSSPMFARMSWPLQNVGKRIKRFKGSATFTVQTKVQRLEINDLATLKEKANTIGGVPVIIRSMVRKGDIWELKFAVAIETMSTPGWNSLQQTLMTKLQILDNRNEALDHRGLTNRVNNNTEIEFTLQFGAAVHPDGSHTGDPAKLVWQAPLETRDVTVKFQFDDLPMPQ